jgi:VWFA-related protein
VGRPLAWFVAFLALLALGLHAGAHPSVGQQAASQAPAITFRVQIDYVEVDAVVVDGTGEFVRTLTKDDFQILEEGVPQTISTFGLVDIPVERAEAPRFVTRPIEPDVQTNARGSDGRIYLIVLDDLHTAALRSGWVRRAAERFITHDVGANDLAAVACTSGRTDSVQDFTNNRRLLLAAVDKFMGNKLRSATANRLDEYNRLRSLGLARSDAQIRDFEELQRGRNARSALETLRRAADFIAGVHGRRKALIFISEGIDYDVTDPFRNQAATDILDATRDAIASATHANVSFYTIDPRGLAAMADETMEMTAPPSDPTLGLGPESLQREIRLAQDSLRVLADETGGFASVNSNDFAGAFDRIRSENSTYYVMGYYPPNERRDGRFRRIEVRVARPGMIVRARRGYVAPSGKVTPSPELDIKERASPAVKEALSSPVPISGLRFAATAAAFKGKPPGASVLLTVEIDGRDLRFTEKDGKSVESIELCTVAVDRRGEVAGGDRQLGSLTLRPETRARVVRAGVRLTDRFDLRPGLYRLRVVAAGSAPGVVGSLTYDLEVPDFATERISMSGLVLTSSRAAEMPSASTDPEISAVLPGPPTTRRVFNADEELSIVAEIYDTQGATPHRVDIATTVQSDDGRVVFSETEERSSAELGGKTGGFGYVHRVPLKGLAPGLYVLKVEARSRLGVATEAAREVQFRIE